MPSVLQNPDGLKWKKTIGGIWFNLHVLYTIIRKHLLRAACKIDSKDKFFSIRGRKCSISEQLFFFFLVLCLMSCFSSSRLFPLHKCVESIKGTMSWDDCFRMPRKLNQYGTFLKSVNSFFFLFLKLNQYFLHERR